MYRRTPDIALPITKDGSLSSRGCNLFLLALTEGYGNILCYASFIAGLIKNVLRAPLPILYPQFCHICPTPHFSTPAYTFYIGMLPKHARLLRIIPIIFNLTAAQKSAVIYRQPDAVDLVNTKYKCTLLHGIRSRDTADTDFGLYHWAKLTLHYEAFLRCYVLL